MTDVALKNPISTTVETVAASNNVLLPISSLGQTLGYTSGVLTTITVVYDSVTYIQTLTYTSGNLTGISKWVAQ